MDSWTIILSISSICVLFYWYITKKYTYWSSKGVNGPKPYFLIGNLVTRATSPPDQLELEWTKKFGRIYGYYAGTIPTLTVTDADLIKKILVKDFQHFVNRRKLNVYHEVMTDNLIMQVGERWKTIRAITSPSFTSGKLRGMHQLMNRCIDKTEQYFDKLTLDNGGSGVMNTKEVISGFTVDVIASTTFGTETNSNDVNNRSNPFVKNALQLFNFHPLKVIAFIAFPRFLNDLLGVYTASPDKAAYFFIDYTRQVVRQRIQSKTKRNDLIQLLLDANIDEKVLSEISYDKLTVSSDSKENKPEPNNGTKGSGKLRKLTETEIVAQCIVFFGAGFETTASTISHAIFELSQNPDIQQRLFEELTSKLDPGLDPNSEEYFDKVNNQIPYLEAVMKETLRKYPPIVRMERRLGTDGYKINGIELEKDQLVEIPTYSVHHDPEYYPEPERFNPDRFMPENKHLLVPYTYLSFGAGPRNCIGMRFAYQEIKLFFAQILPKFRFSITSETPAQLSFKKGSLFLISNQFPIRISRR